MTEIGFKEWQKVDMRVGKILKVEDIENADKLYKLVVDVGEERQLVAGLKKYYKKEDLQNKRCVVLVNLEKKKLMGIESEGMILAAVNKDKSEVRLIQPDGEIELGSSIR
jgi:methionyl-tRNA synthetase